MRRSIHRVVMVGLAALTVACVPTGGAPTGDATVITHEQLTEANKFNSVYDAVLALRGNWLSTRGSNSINSPTQVRVYMDNSLLGGVDALRGIAPAAVSYVKHYDGVQATARWGLGNGAGVIYLSTTPGSSPEGGRRAAAGGRRLAVGG